MTPYHHLVACWCRGPRRRVLRSQFHRWSTVKITPFFLKGKKLASSFSKYTIPLKGGLANSKGSWPVFQVGLLSFKTGAIAKGRAVAYHSCDWICTLWWFFQLDCSYSASLPSWPIRLPKLLIRWEILHKLRSELRPGKMHSTEQWGSLAQCSALGGVHQTGHVPPDVHHWQPALWYKFQPSHVELLTCFAGFIYWKVYFASF